MLVDAMAKAREAFTERDALADDGATSPSASVFRSCAASTPAPPCFGPFSATRPAMIGVIEIQAGRGRTAHGEGRGIQLMIRQQHQRAADQIGGVLVLRRPDARDLQMKRFGRGFGVQHGRDHQPHDAAAEHRAPFVGAGERPRVGAGGQRQHGDGAIDRVGPARSLGHRAHFVRHHGAIVLLERIDAGDIPQQRRGMFERVALGEVDAIDAAIDRPVLGDGRDRRVHHAADRRRNCACRAARAPARAAPSACGRPRRGSGGCGNPATAPSGSARG